MRRSNPIHLVRVLHLQQSTRNIPYTYRMRMTQRPRRPSAALRQHAHDGHRIADIRDMHVLFTNVRHTCRRARYARLQ